MPETRLLTRTSLRQVLGGIPWTQIEERMSKGQLPGPLWGLKPDDKNARWDQKAVDRALDLASDLPNTIEGAIAEMDRHFGLR